METLDQQFRILVDTNEKSLVMRYADLNFVNEPIRNFICKNNLAEPEEQTIFDQIFFKATEITCIETIPNAVD